MNSVQVQIFRVILRYSQKSLSDLAFAIEKRGQCPEKAISLVKSIDSTLIDILSSFDGEEKLKAAKKFMSSEYPQLDEVRKSMRKEFENISRSFYDDFKRFVAERSQQMGDLIPSNEIDRKFGDFKALQDPFSDQNIQNPPLQVEEFVHYFQKTLKLEESDVQKFLDDALYYDIFHYFMKQMTFMDEYKVKLDSGVVPEQITEQPRDNEKILKNAENQPLKKEPITLKTIAMTLPKNKQPANDQGWDSIITEATERGIQIDNNGNQNNSSNNQSDGSMPGSPRSLLNNMGLSGNLADIRLGNDTAPKNEGMISPVKQQDAPTNDEESKIDQMLEKMEPNKTDAHDWKEIIVARLEQKALLLQKENQILRENIDIVTKQKIEVQNLYEDHLSELLKQNEYLKNENSKLKESENTNHDEEDDDSLI